MDFKQIEAYVNVVKQKSFSKAAYISDVKQPTISAHVSALEKEMGVRLLDRTHREARPTPEGQLFFEYAINMINMRETAVHSVRKFQENISGVIRIHSSNTPAEYILPDLVSRFTASYPNVRFQIEQYDSRQVIENVMQNKAEIGFTGSRGMNSLSYMPLFEDRLVVITSLKGKYRLPEKQPVSASDIAGYPLVFREHGSGTRKMTESLMTGYKINPEDLNIAVTVNNNEILKRFVKAGTGIAVISRCSIDKDDEDAFDIAELDTKDITRKFYLVFNEKITGTPAVNLFRSFTEECFREI